MSESRELGIVEVNGAVVTAAVENDGSVCVAVAESSASGCLWVHGDSVEISGADNLRAIARILLLAADGKRIDGAVQPDGVVTTDDLAGLARAADGGGL